MPSATTERSTNRTGTVRERLLAAADELFYAEGVHVVGIDRIIERAGVAKASLYSAFGSKDELVRAYLEGRHERRRAAIEEGLARSTDPRDRLLGVFDVLAELTHRPGYHGCAFANAAAESEPGSPAMEAAATYRQWVRELFGRLCAEAGARDADELAGQLQLLYDGSAYASRMDGDLDAPLRARVAAALLLDAASR